MKTISDYTIYCTSEQTKKALELGASITKEQSSLEMYQCVRTDEKDSITGQPVWLIPPTAEQMIGWLEVQGLTFEVIMACKKIAYFTLWRIDDKGAHPIIGRSDSDYPSRKEATLKAIDLALDYLNNNGLIK